MREVIGLAMQEQKTSLRRNRHTDLICDFQTIATFKTLFRKEHLDVAQKLDSIIDRKPLEKRNVALDCLPPIFRKRLSPQPTPSPLLQ